MEDMRPQRSAEAVSWPPRPCSSTKQTCTFKLSHTPSWGRASLEDMRPRKSAEAVR